MIEYSLEVTLSFPDEMYDKSVDGYYIIVAPKMPNWLVLNENEYKMFDWLRKGLSIRESLENYYKEICQNEEICLSIMTRLLTQIDDANFNKNALIINEEPIESIKKKVHIVTTNGCNMCCEHCYMSAGRAPLKTIDLEKTIQLISDFNRIYGE